MTLLPMVSLCPSCGAKLKSKSVKICPKCGHIIIYPVS
ncbi:MAG: zinc-ribbon domain-containing protein [Oscillospiraceae bacterium]|nr:zinc-ribbon domain-containing protein [Oscillospiraceae bacterium]